MYVSPETDDFALKKISGCEEKLANFFTSVIRNPYKNILKTRVSPPPLTEMSVKNVSFSLP